MIEYTSTYCLFQRFRIMTDNLVLINGSDFRTQATKLQYLDVDYAKKLPRKSCQKSAGPTILQTVFFCITQYKRIRCAMQNDPEPKIQLTKQLSFKQYSSLELVTRDKFIAKIKEAGFDNNEILWVASQKIHGSNFSIHFNGQTVRYGRRTDFMSNDIPVPCENPDKHFVEKFYDARNLVKKFHNSLGDIFDNIKKTQPNLLKFAIYGQYFGGSWPCNHPSFVKGPMSVQAGVYYTPHHEFFAFDIFLVTTEKAYWVDVTDISGFLKNWIPTVPIFAKGSFEEIFNLDTKFDSTIPELLGLPKLQNNIVQGLVIRPNKNLNTPVFLQRIVLKKKNAQFLQKAYAPAEKEKKQKKDKPADPELVPYIEQLEKYLNFNRIDSVLSKFPDLKDRNKLKELVSEDILSDAFKDEIKMHPEPQKHKKIVQQLKGKILKEINSYYIKH